MSVGLSVLPSLFQKGLYIDFYIFATPIVNINVFLKKLAATLLTPLPPLSGPMKSTTKKKNHIGTAVSVILRYIPKQTPSYSYKINIMWFLQIFCYGQFINLAWLRGNFAWKIDCKSWDTGFTNKTVLFSGVWRWGGGESLVWKIFI